MNSQKCMTYLSACFQIGTFDIQLRLSILVTTLPLSSQITLLHISISIYSQTDLLKISGLDADVFAFMTISFVIKNWYSCKTWKNSETSLAHFGENFGCGENSTESSKITARVDFRSTENGEPKVHVFTAIHCHSQIHKSSVGVLPQGLICLRFCHVGLYTKNHR